MALPEVLARGGAAVILQWVATVDMVDGEAGEENGNKSSARKPRGPLPVDAWSGAHALSHCRLGPLTFPH